MPMFYFHLHDGESILDSDGTDLDNIGAARAHALGVVRELTFNSRSFLAQE
jgi:hypothetical protein